MISSLSFRRFPSACPFAGLLQNRRFPSPSLILPPERGQRRPKPSPRPGVLWMIAAAIGFGTAALPGRGQTPANDDCANASTVVTTPQVFNGSTVNATTDGPVEQDCGDSGKDVWFKYTPATNGTARVDTAGSRCSWIA